MLRKNQSWIYKYWDMLLKIYDPGKNYEIDTINLDNYDLENAPEEVVDLLVDIISSYEDDDVD